MTIDGSTAAHGQASHAPTSRDGRGRRWLQLGWQPIGDVTLEADDEDSRRHVPELYVTDHRAARILSAGLAVGVAIGTVFWWLEASDRFDVPTLVCAGCAPPDWFRWTQLVVAAVGVVAAVTQVAYLLNFAVRGLVWRRWRGVAIVFGTLAGVYTVLWWVQRLWF